MTERTVSNWVADFELLTIVKDSKRGKHSKTMSPITEDPEFREMFKDYVRQNSRKAGKIFFRYYEIWSDTDKYCQIVMNIADIDKY